MLVAKRPVSASPRPWLFGLLILPQGVYLGLVTLALPFLLSKAGVPVVSIAHATSLLSLPWICYFLWAPVLDVKLRRRTWLIVAAVCASVCVALAIPFAYTQPLSIVIGVGLLGAVAASLVLAACGGLILTTLNPPQQATASAWLEAGKLAGSALGGAAILWLAQHASPPITGVLSGLLVALPVLGTYAILEPAPPTGLPFKHRLNGFFTEIRSLFTSPRRAANLLLLASPLGVGASVGLLPAIAKSYGVGVTGVILTNGIAGGVILALGSLCGAGMPDSWDRRLSYAGASLANVFAVAVLLLSRQPAVYFVGAVLYLGTTGLCWARYAALVAETACSGGQVVSTRYSLVAVAGNIPFVYMLWLEGLGYQHYGVNGLLWTDAAGSLVGLCLATLIYLLSAR